MKSLEEVRKIKEDFEKGLIKEEEIDQETRDEIMQMYKEEIEEIRKDIIILREENKMYENKIEEIKNKLKK